MIAEGSYTMEQVFSSPQRWNKESGYGLWCCWEDAAGWHGGCHDKEEHQCQQWISHRIWLCVLHDTFTKVLHSMRLNEAPLKPWVIISSNGSVDCAHSDCRWARRIMWTYGYTEDNQHAVLKDHSHLVIHTWCLAPYTQVLTPLLPLRALLPIRATGQLNPIVESTVGNICTGGW